MAKKKIAELELSLLHLQQNVEIPDIYLSIHPIIQRTVDKVCKTFRQIPQQGSPSSRVALPILDS